MTKHVLKSYLKIRKELRQITRLLRSPEANIAYDTEEGRQLLALYRAKRDALVDAQRMIEEAIDHLDYDERILLRARYIEGRSWTAVSQEIHYSRSATFALHDRAISKLNNL